MLSKPHTLDAEDRLQAALTAWQTGGLYYSPEAYANAYIVNPSTF